MYVSSVTTFKKRILPYKVTAYIKQRFRASELPAATCPRGLNIKWAVTSNFKHFFPGILNQIELWNYYFEKIYVAQIKFKRLR